MGEMKENRLTSNSQPVVIGKVWSVCGIIHMCGFAAVMFILTYSLAFIMLSKEYYFMYSSFTWSYKFSLTGAAESTFLSFSSLMVVLLILPVVSLLALLYRGVMSTVSEMSNLNKRSGKSLKESIKNSSFVQFGWALFNVTAYMATLGYMVMYFVFAGFYLGQNMGVNYLPDLTSNEPTLMSMAPVSFSLDKDYNVFNRS